MDSPPESQGSPVKRSRGGEEMFEPSEHPSMTTEEDLEALRERYRIPLQFRLEAPTSEDRICFPPEGRLGFYEESFVAGLRLPLHPFIEGFFKFLGVSPAAVTPNSWRLICNFIVICHIAGVPSLYNVFLRFFFLKGRQGWWYVTPRSSRHAEGASLFPKGPSKIAGWKEKFFFVSFESDEGWDFCPWGSLSKQFSSCPTLNEEEEKIAQVLRSLPPLGLKEALSAENLFKAGISRSDPEEIGLWKKAVKKRAVHGKRSRDGALLATSTASLPTSSEDREIGHDRLWEDLSTEPVIESEVPARKDTTVSWASPLTVEISDDQPSEEFEVVPVISSVKDSGIRPSMSSGSPAGGAFDSSSSGDREKAASPVWTPKSRKEKSALEDGLIANQQFLRFLLPRDAKELEQGSPECQRQDTVLSYTRLGHHIRQIMRREETATIRSRELEERASRAESELQQLQEDKLKQESCLEEATSSLNKLRDEVRRLTRAHSKEYERRLNAEKELDHLNEIMGKMEEECAKAATLTARLDEEREKAIEAYKGSEECHRAKLLFSQAAYSAGKRRACQDIAAHFKKLKMTLDLSFMESDEESSEDGQEGGDEPGPSSGPSDGAT